MDRKGGAKLLLIEGAKVSAVELTGDNPLCSTAYTEIRALAMLDIGKGAGKKC